MTDHETYMRRCLTLAAKGLGKVKTNPLVGCVIVENNEIIGEGFHEYFGGPHAEVNAFRSVQDQSRLKNATLYVNLEPCHHFGKTPPCSLKIVEMGVRKVIIGQRDPFPSVNGKGIDYLEQNGIHVEVGVLETECRYLNKRFNTFHDEHRPYIIMKWAQSTDGFIDAIRSHSNQSSTAISSLESRQLVHQWRSEEMGILVGRKTIEMDNPQLNVRWGEGDSPIRMVIDVHHQLKYPSALQIFDQSEPTIIFTAAEPLPDSQHFLEWVSVDSQDVWTSIFDILYKRGISSVIVEGGCKTLQYLIDHHLWDEARVFISPMMLADGVKAPVLNLENHSAHKVGDDVLQYFYKT
jgi:diaminohydroxyphosphoribosylaminopyrimidine deaminase / 5-amino-6-(5-phosphoribosylamino)uracil reductase